MSEAATPEAPRRPWWVISLYYAEGLPFAMVRTLSTAFFKDHGASLPAIGLTSLFGLPWTLKFLWAPLVDAFATKRRWLLLAELGLAVTLALLALSTTAASPLKVAAVVFLVVALVSATHDIAVDGYYLEALDRRQQAAFVGFQQAAYRVAMITGAGGVGWLAGHFSWRTGYLTAAVALALLWLVHRAFLPRVESERRPLRGLARYLVRPSTLAAVAAAVLVVWAVRALAGSATFAPLAARLGRISTPSWIVIGLLAVLALAAARAPALKRRLYASDSAYALAFVDYLDQPRIGVILGFIVTFRIGEAMLQNMSYPFLKGVGITLEQYSIAHNTVGLAATMVGGILGGWLISRRGLGRCIWPFVLALNSLNLLYMGMAWHYAPLAANPTLGRADFGLVCVLLALESFGAGLGMSAFGVFIMRTTRADHKAAHFAIATGLMNVAGTLAGVVSGFAAAALGFTAYFALTFAATIPSMALIPRLPHLADGGPPDAASSEDA